MWEEKVRMFDNGSVLADEIESLLVITVSSISPLYPTISRGIPVFYVIKRIKRKMSKTHLNRASGSHYLHNIVRGAPCFTRQRHDVRARRKKIAHAGEKHDVTRHRDYIWQRQNQPIPLFISRLAVGWGPEASAVGYLTGSYYGRVTKEF